MGKSIEHKLLKEYISLIVEAAVSTQAAEANNLALLVSGGTLILYDPKYYTNFLQQSGVESVSSETGGILGYIKAVKGPQGSCHNAGEVVASAAIKGYGPLMYDLVMTMFGAPLMPDRSSLSPKAAGIWNFYDKNRNDIKKFPLDDMDNPKNQDPSDDCSVWDCSQYGGVGPDGTCAVNKAYTGANLNSGQLQANHNAFVKSIEDGAEFSKAMFTAADIFFDERSAG